MSVVPIDRPAADVGYVLAHFGAVEQVAADRWAAACPRHAGAPPLTVRLSKSGRVHLDCPQRCGQTAIAQAAGFDPKYLYPLAPGEAPPRLREPGEEPEAREAPPSRFRVYLDDELDALPPLEWLVDGILPAGGLAAMIGAPEAGKSFAAIALACSLATGHRWLGRPVRQGAVLYVTGEGTFGLRQRVRAWKARHGKDGDRLGVGFVTEAANLLEAPDATHVARAADQLTAETGQRVALVVIDTMARAMPGGDENSARDVGLVVARADLIRQLTGAAVLIVHHAKKDSDQERGSTALRGACDTMLLVRGDDDEKEIVCEKQKEAPHFAPLPVLLVPSLDSVVSELRAPDRPGDPIRLTRRRRQALDILASAFGDRGATATDWETSCLARGMSRSTYFDARTKLVEGRFVDAITRGKSERFTATWEGKRALADTAAPAPTPALSPAAARYAGQSNSCPTPQSNGTHGAGGSQAPGVTGPPLGGPFTPGPREPAAAAGAGPESESNPTAQSSFALSTATLTGQPEPPHELYDEAAGWSEEVL